MYSIHRTVFDNGVLNMDSLWQYPSDVSGRLSCDSSTDYSACFWERAFYRVTYRKGLHGTNGINSDSILQQSKSFPLNNLDGVLSGVLESHGVLPGWKVVNIVLLSLKSWDA